MVAAAIHTARSQEVPRPETTPNTALVNGKWFNGNSFEPRTVYSVGGRFTSEKPARVDRTLDLAGLWIIPPYADAHNHSIGTGQVELDKIAVHRYLSDGVFYVKMQANIPIDEEIRKRIGLDQPDSVDAALAQEAITASHSHPAELADIFFFPDIYVPGFSKEAYEKASIGPIDTVEELDRKWPAVLAQKPDFIKAILIYSDEYEKRKNDTSGWIHALDPRVLAMIVEKAHAAHLRVSAHVNTSADFHKRADGRSRRDRAPSPDSCDADFQRGCRTCSDARGGRGHNLRRGSQSAAVLPADGGPSTGSQGPSGQP
jgi:hypothetical protein